MTFPKARENRVKLHFECSICILCEYRVMRGYTYIDHFVTRFFSNLTARRWQIITTTDLPYYWWETKGLANPVLNGGFQWTDSIPATRLPSVSMRTHKHVQTEMHEGICVGNK